MENENVLMTLLPVILKLLILFGMLLYVAFAFIIVRQEQLMSKVFSGASEPVVRMLVFVHLVIAVGLLVLGIILL